MDALDTIKFFADYIFKELGIIYKEDTFYQLESRLKRVTKDLGYDSLEAFCAASKIGLPADKKQFLLDAATNNETSFFRDTGVFSAFESAIAQIPSSRPEPLSVWCAASSTGQEPYSIAMILSEKLNSLPGQSFHILATDISSRVLKIASEGTYGELEIGRGLPADRLAKHFSPYEDPENKLAKKWRVKPALRDRIDFRSLNLQDTWSGIDQYDFVFCRNVLIYQSVESKKKIVERMARHIKDDGFLVLGGAESLIGITDALERKSVGGSTFYQKVKASLPKAV